MMTRRAALLAVACAGALAVRADDDPRREFLYRQPLEGGIASGELFRVRVPREVFDACPSFPSDLRVIDARLRAWPFFVWVPAGHEELQSLSAEALNRSEVAEPQRYFRQDLRIRPEPFGKGPARHDRLVIRMGGENFFRKVDVLGSDDRQVWAELGSGYLVAQGDSHGADNREIQYPPSTYPFLQVRIHPDARSASEALDLQSISVARLAREEGEQEELALEWSQPAGEQKPGVQVIVADLGVQHRPVQRLRFDAAGRDFARPLKVQGRNAESNEWRWVTDGGIHRMGGQTRDAVDLRGAAYRYWRVELFRYEDAPLEIRRITAEAVPQYLVVEAVGGPDDKPAMYYGTDRINVPRFDLQQRTSKSAISAAPLREPGRRQMNPDRVASGLGRYGRALGLFAVGVVSLLVLIVIANMIRRQTQS